MPIFTASGHPNIRATHKTTFEFTKENHLTTKGDCIVGINATFTNFKEILHKDRLVITIEADGIKERITAQPNPAFSDNKEIVIRKTAFVSSRTLAINADKAAKDLSRELITILKKPETKITVNIN